LTKHTLKNMILNVIDNSPRGYAEELAIISNYSSGSALKKVITDTKKEFEKFHGLIELVNHIWGKESVEVMAQYSTEIDPNKKNARNFLEYLASNRKFEAFNNLLDRMDTCSNNESIEWARLYRMQYKYELTQSKDGYYELLKEINQIHVTVTEMKVYKNMLINYCDHQLEKYQMVKYVSEDISQEIELIENGYIKEMYMIRLNEIMSYNYLRVHNNTEMARKCADAILSSHANTAYKAYSYFIKGYSHLFDSYEETLKGLNKSLELYESLNRPHDVKELSEMIEFTNVYWDKHEDEKCVFIKNQFLFDIKKGKNISSKLSEYENGIEKEMWLFFTGYNDKDNKILLLSLINFIKKNDLFLANLVKIELLKNGYDQDILDELVGMNLT
jgi:hypothetical protein